MKQLMYKSFSIRNLLFYSNVNDRKFLLKNALLSSENLLLDDLVSLFWCKNE